MKYDLSGEGINPFSFSVASNGPSSESDDRVGVNIEVVNITEIAQEKKIKKR